MKGNFDKKDDYDEWNQSLTEPSTTMQEVPEAKNLESSSLDIWTCKPHQKFMCPTCAEQLEIQTVNIADSNSTQ